MIQYHKIKTVFKRDPDNHYKTLLIGEWSLPEFEYLRDNEWIFTEKVDGTNIRVMWDGESVTFGGKTDRAEIPSRLVNALNDMFLGEPNDNRFKAVFDGPACLYGEGYGAKIQKGGNYRPDQGFVLFDVRVDDYWLKRNDVLDISERLGIDVVPVIGMGTLSNMVERVQNGFLSQWGPFQAEGIVARPKVELKSRNNDRIITKIKYKDFR